ncbi:MAG: glycosyltransferase family 39 protein, partial [Phaeodactylibacter sp.]|nr:glycosyltransferase family 39 protein [Phaeodactylibacter sp.]
ALLGALFFLPFLGGVHLFDWDEVNFAEISREMLITKEYTRVYVNFEPFFQKPPFFLWLQALAMAIFGVGEFAARFPNAICGILTLPLLFKIGQKLKGNRFGIIWAGVYFGSVLPFLYFKSGIIDPWFNFFIFLGIYYFILAYWKRDDFEGISLPNNALWYLFLGGFWIGMGMLTKGPVAYLIAVLTMGVYWVYQRFRFYVTIPQFLLFTFGALIVSLIWFGLETMKNGPEFMIEFNLYQYKLFSTPDAGHAGFPGYHFVVLLVGCFPASIFALRAFSKLPDEEYKYQDDFRIWMKFLLWTVLILFTIVKSKIVHYSSMCYFPLTYLAALTIEGMIRGDIEFKPWLRGFLYSIGGLYIFVTLALPFVGMQAEVLAPLFKDPFAQGNLQADVNWTGFEVVPGLFLLALLIVFNRTMKKDRQRAFLYLFGGTGLFVMLTLIFFIQRIEGYSQRAAVEFFKTHASEDAHYLVTGYKSYVHLFYARPQASGEACFKNEACTDVLLNGDIDKPVYLVTKVHKADDHRANPNLELIEEKNGFVFFRRLPD